MTRTTGGDWQRLVLDTRRRRHSWRTRLAKFLRRLTAWLDP